MHSLSKRPGPWASLAPALLFKKQDRRLWGPAYMYAHPPEMPADKLCHGRQPWSTSSMLTRFSVEEGRIAGCHILCAVMSLLGV